MRSSYSFRLVQIIVLCAAVSATAFAQYGGSTGTGTGTGTASSSGGYGSSSGKAIGIGVGVAAAVTGIALYVHHRHNAAPTQASLVGCTQSAQNGMSVTNEKDNKTYSLAAEGTGLKAGERVALRGRMARDGSGDQIFRVQNVVKDYGTCSLSSALVAPSASR